MAYLTFCKRDILSREILGARSIEIVDLMEFQTLGNTILDSQ